jgi:DNA-binding transcriptional LysR family regulator
MIDVRRLAVLHELHRCGTVTAAAAALNLTPSAVSQQLAALARQVGVPLVESQGRRLQLTGAGMVLVEHAELVLCQLEKAETELRALKSGDTGVVTVGTFPTAINGLVIPAMRALRAARPSVRVQVRELRVDDAVGALMQGQLDILLWLAYPGSRPAEELGATSRPLLEDTLDVVLPADHPRAGAVAIPLTDLQDQPWVSGSLSSPCRRIVDAACAAVGFTPRVEHWSDDWSAVVGLVAAGAGVALVPRLAQPDADPGVVIRPVAGHAPRRHLVLLTRPAAAAAPHVTAVVDELVAQAARIAVPAAA